MFLYLAQDIYTGWAPVNDVPKDIERVRISNGDFVQQAVKTVYVSVYIRYGVGHVLFTPLMSSAAAIVAKLGLLCKGIWGVSAAVLNWCL